MHFGLSEEQQQLVDIARRFLAEVPSARSRLEREDGHVYEAETWARISEELGWTAMSLPEEVEGWGFGTLELALVLEETGRTLLPSPLFTSAGLAAQALIGVAEAPWAADRLGWLATGGLATVALEELGVAARQRAFDLSEGADAPLRVQESADGGYILHGSVRRVLDGDRARLLLVETPVGLVAVEPGDPGVRVEPVASLDITRPVATVHLEGVVVSRERVFPQHDPSAFRTATSALLAAEQTGVAQGALDLTVAYAKVREQYGQPIGSFQAVQHQLADVLVAVECARSATWYAAAALDAGAQDAEEAALTALCTATEAATLATGQAIQLHGGIGFTWEHDAHLYFKRAAANRHLLGSPDELRATVAAWLLGPIAAVGGAAP